MKAVTYQDILPRFIDMAVFAADAQEILGERSFDAWIDDKSARYGVERALELLGEAARLIPEGVKAEFPSIPWRRMVAMRTVLAHDYGGIQFEILYRTVRELLPGVESEIQTAVAAIRARGNATLP